MPTFKVGKVPSLKLRLLDAEVLGDGLSGTTADLLDGEGEVGVRLALGGLGAIEGSVDLEPDVKELTGEEVGSVASQYMCC